MKKNFTLLLAFFMAASFCLTAQSNRMVMVEEGTQASCPPCASQNPGFDGILDNAANADKVVVLKYQTSWPGFDQMNLDNPGEVQDRVDYYAIDGVPSGFVNGVGIANDCGAYDTAPACFTQAKLDAAYGEMSEFDMVLEASVVGTMMTITGSVTATMEVSGDLRLRMAITEKTINYDDAPGGTNGETQYHHVLKKFVWGSMGADLEDTWAVGDVFEINETFDLSTITVYSMSELEVVAFVQNDETKAVHQAVRDAAVDVEVDLNVNSTALEINNVPTTFCSGTQSFAPIVKLQNTGNDNLTAVLFTYSANGGAEQTYEWTGDLETFQKMDVQLDAIEFTTVPTVDGYLDINLSNPNDLVDEDPSDNEISTPLINAATENTIELTITTDNYGYETYWAIVNPFGGIVAEGGNTNVGINGGGQNSGAAGDPGAYDNASTNTETITIDAAGCYQLVVVDSYGDGLCCSYGNGSISMKNSLDNVIINMPGDFGDAGSANFSNTVISNVETPEGISKFSINPNPVTDVALVNFSMANSAKTTVTVVDALGKQILVENFGTLASGVHSREIQMAGLANGVYFVRLNAGNNIVTKKITLVK